MGQVMGDMSIAMEKYVLVYAVANTLCCTLKLQGNSTACTVITAGNIRLRNYTRSTEQMRTPWNRNAGGASALHRRAAAVCKFAVLYMPCICHDI